MDPSSQNPEPDQRSKLLDQIRSAQELGSECFLRCDEEIYEVKIRPGDSAELSLRSLEAAAEVDFNTVSFSFAPAANVYQLYSSLVEGAGELRPEEFRAFFSEHPLEQIGSLKELAALFYEHFGSGSDWRVYTCFFNALPDDIADEVVQRLIVPVLAAGELGPAVIDAEEFLRGIGWTDEQIRASYAADTRVERSARHYFFELTGTPVSQIKTSTQLAEVIIADATKETMQRPASSSAAALITLYVQAHYSERDVAHLASAIEPFLHLLTSAEYQKITDAYWRCEHALPWFPPNSESANPASGADHDNR